ALSCLPVAIVPLRLSGPIWPIKHIRRGFVSRFALWCTDGQFFKLCDGEPEFAACDLELAFFLCRQRGSGFGLELAQPRPLTVEVLLRARPCGTRGRHHGVGSVASPLGKRGGVERGPRLTECRLGTGNVILGVASIFSPAGRLVVAHPLAHRHLSPRRRHARPGILVIEAKDRLASDYFVIDTN